jgi:hypothetical protein
MATAIVLLSCSAALYARDDKRKPSSSSSSSHSAPPRNYSSGHSSTPNNSNSHPPSNNSAPSGHTATPNISRPTNNTSTPQGNNNPATNNNNAPRQFGNRTATPGGNSTPPSGGQNNASPRNYGNSNPNSNSNVNRPVNGGGNNNQPRQFGGSTPNNNTRPASSNFNGRSVQPGSYRGPAVVRARNGGEVHRDSSGQIREVHTPGGAVIHHAPDGVRRVEVARPGGRVVVASAHGYGYVQRPLVVNNVTYVQRTYVVGGVSYARVYRPWAWGGFHFAVYTPVAYYHPAFYTWAWTPWARPVYYGWGWGGSPWFGFYGGFFQPYPYYASPAFWLTDYLISQQLQAAYQERMAAQAAAQQANYAAANGGPVALTPEVKDQIAAEVRRQLEQERAEQAGQMSAANGPPPLFSGGSHVFVVSSALQVNDGGPGCTLTEGDVLQMAAPPAPNEQYANVVVLASRGQDCRKGAGVQVGLNDLQEMQNQMRATIDRGLGDLRAKQGQGGLPSVPASANVAPVNTQLAAQVQPDANVAAEINSASTEADRAEQDTISQAPAGAATVNISLGMTVAQVESALGRPKDIADLGPKKIYVYPDMKITFKDGRVADVQ